MRALIVKDPYATWIVEGKKTKEYRTQSTNIRERIGIIKAGTKTIIGEVDLVGDMVDFNYGGFAWLLKNPLKYKIPKPYKHPRGAQIWVRIG